MKNRTILEIELLRERFWKMSYRIASNNVNRAHPETGGSIHLAHNWGNDAARQAISDFQERTHKLTRLIDCHQSEAFKRQYPDHLRNR